MNRMHSSLRSKVSYVGVLLERVSTALLFGMMVLVFVSTMGRYLFASPIPNLINIISLIFLPAVIWLYAPVVQFEEDNITMDLVSNNLRDETNRVVKIIFYPFVSGLFGIAFYDLLMETLTLWRQNVWTTGTIQIPRYLSRGLITVGVLALTLTIVLQVLAWIAEE